MSVRPVAVKRPAIGRKCGSAFGSVIRTITCAATKSARKNTAYESDAVEMTSFRAM
jgi:hypothetical protein